jgi:predicted lipoprotein with Yx(FWY)xxD motif
MSATKRRTSVRKLAACIFVGALVLAACGGDDDDSATSDTTQADSGDSGSTTTAAEGSAADVVTTGTTDLGDVLVDSSGKTVYAFTADTDGKSTCTGDCAGTWPAVMVQGDALPAGLDDSIFSVVEGEDETYQLAANNQPLYTFSGDTAEGDTNGQGIGGAWFAVGPDGNMLKDAAATTGGAGGDTTTTMGGSDSGGDDGGY